MIIMPRALSALLVAAMLLSATVCPVQAQTAKNLDAATAHPTSTAPASPAVDDPDVASSEKPVAPVPDPLYHWNKFWFGFNHIFLSGFMRPFAKGYAMIMPRKARTGINNAYQNFVFPIRFVNSLLQLNLTKASREFGRFMINSTIGIGGLIDVAKADPNLQPGNEDFGQTLGHYGMGEGFYIVWPVLGPSNLRDSIGLAGDAAANPLTWLFGPWVVHDDYNPWFWPYIVKGGVMFNNMPDTLNAYDSIVKPAIDPYSAVKDASIQYRRNAVAQ